MITRYSLLHPAIDGDIIFTYEAGLLIEYIINGSISPTVLQRLLAKFPVFEVNLETLSNHTATITKLPPDLSFNRFWAKYNYKPAGSSKKVAENKWDKLSDSDRMNAIKYIPIYDRSLNGGIGKKYAETYLNQKIWEK